jgi:hypothetical protein
VASRTPGPRIYKSLTSAGGFSFQAGNRVANVSSLALDLRRTAGFLVADARGRIVGRVECPMYGTSPEEPDALSVRSGFLARRRRLVPADSIEQIDDGSKVIGLRVDRDTIRTFL